MADVRGASGAPGTLQFSGVSNPSPTTPLYVDTDNGNLYALIGNTVTLIGSTSGGSTIAEQIFAPRRLPSMWA